MRLLILAFILIGVPVLMALMTVVANDMDRRGLDGRKYGALTFVLFPVGLTLWLLARRRHPVVPEERRLPHATKRPSPQVAGPGAGSSEAGPSVSRPDASADGEDG